MSARSRAVRRQPGWSVPPSSHDVERLNGGELDNPRTLATRPAESGGVMNKLSLALLVAVLALVAGVARAGGAGAAGGSSETQAVPNIVIGSHLTSRSAETPPSSAECMAAFVSFGLVGTCYSPQDIRNEYNVTPLLNRGIDGAGQTIVIFDAFGSPTIQNDL